MFWSDNAVIVNVRWLEVKLLYQFSCYFRVLKHNYLKLDLFHSEIYENMSYFWQICSVCFLLQIIR